MAGKPYESDLRDVVEDLRKHADARRAQDMSAYMKDRYPFLGIGSPERTQITRPFLSMSKKLSPSAILSIMSTLYAKPEREFVYFALDLFTRAQGSFEPSHIDRACTFINKKPWWDSVDSFRKGLSLWCKNHRDDAEHVLDRCLDGSMWERRVAINLQLLWKEETNTAWLDRAMTENLDDPEFFIQKAIGWSLRDYSKTNPKWVASYIRRHKVTGLAAREGSKYL